MKKIILFTTVILISSCSVLRPSLSEISLTDAKNEDTSVIRAAVGDERIAGFSWSGKAGVLPTLVHIRDIGKNGEIVDLITNNNYPRVTEGEYIVRVHCSSNGYYLSSSSSHDVNVSVSKGEVYLIDCTGDINTHKAIVRTLPNPKKQQHFFKRD